jgi:hypothetical protein
MRQLREIDSSHWQEAIARPGGICRGNGSVIYHGNPGTCSFERTCNGATQ